MSWFTTDAKYQPMCTRCKSGTGAVLIKRAGGFDIYDCRRCGAVTPRQETASRAPRRSRLAAAAP